MAIAIQSVYSLPSGSTCNVHTGISNSAFGTVIFSRVQRVCDAFDNLSSGDYAPDYLFDIMTDVMRATKRDLTMFLHFGNSWNDSNRCRYADILILVQLLERRVAIRELEGARWCIFEILALLNKEFKCI